MSALGNGAETALILYDGYCALCDASVHFLQSRQRNGALAYASLQSERGQAVLSACGLPAADFDTVILYERGRCYQRSKAALLAMRRLRFPWPLLSALLIIPGFLRDPIYNLIAHNRYRWFGRKPRA
jgi:predicted DCC family thiol-disulfide oxidoreductase YuxK